MNRLREDNDSEASPVYLPAATPPTSAAQKVGEELIGTCVTPSRIKCVHHILEQGQWHICALRLLPYFFSKEELSTSNTDGSHEKKCLDSHKLNSLKILVFSKFPVSSPAEKDKAWRLIKGKINSKCRAAKREVFLFDARKMFLMIIYFCISWPQVIHCNKNS